MNSFRENLDNFYLVDLYGLYEEVLCDQPKVNSIARLFPKEGRLGVVLRYM